ncbi:MAG: hypothetical protein WC162_11935 [Sphaerochaetaceae bacterium]
MLKAFLDDTGLNQKQFDLICELYDKIKTNSLHLNLVEQGIPLIEKQDYKALFILFDLGFKEFGPIYPLVLIYCLYPYIVKLYNRLTIADSIRKSTLSDIAIWVNFYEDEHEGNTGLKQYIWIAHDLCAKVLRLERLQFEQNFFKFPYSIYYDTKLLRYRTFAQEGLLCTDDGYISNGSNPSLGSWTTTNSVKDDYLLAHEINQELGCISQEVNSVPISDLKLICTKGSPFLSVHIPSGEPLTPSLVDKSFSLALKIYNPSLFVSETWLLDPELMKVLPSDSNICNFMQRFFKFPIPLDIPQIYERVFGFGTTESDVLAWKCTNNLQKKVQQHIKNGGVFRTMGGYIPVSIKL